MEGGLFSLVLATAILAVSVRSILRIKGALQIGLMTLMAVWFVSSLIGTVGESRTTWLLLGIVAVSRRLVEDQPEHLDCVFSTPGLRANPSLTERLP